MSAIDHTLSARAKLERADQHINNFRIEETKFRKSGGYRSVAYDDPKTGDRVIEFKLVAHPPPLVIAIVGDAIHNLRSSLDHLAYEMVRANGGTPNDATAFPIFFDCESFEASLERKIGGASKNVLDLIKSLKPYQGGNDSLWHLHRLDIVDKHRLLIPVAAHNDLVVHPLGNAFQGFPRNERGNIVICHRGMLIDGTELFRLPRAERPEIYQDPKFGFEIAFSEIVEGQPIIFVLQQLRNLVFRIIETFSPLL